MLRSSTTEACLLKVSLLSEPFLGSVTLRKGFGLLVTLGVHVKRQSPAGYIPNRLLTNFCGDTSQGKSLNEHRSTCISTSQRRTRYATTFVHVPF